MYKNLFRSLLASFFILYSCSPADLSHDKKYNKYISYFDQSLTSHFPSKYKSMKNNYTYTVDTTAHFNTEEINLTLKNASEQINEAKSKYKLETYSTEDGCLIVVNDFLNNKNLILDDETTYQSKYSIGCKKYGIIPNFWNNFYGTSDTKSKLSNDFKYIIIDSKTGVFSSKIREDVSYMPEQFRHGYSRGIAYNEREGLIVYWLILW